MIDYNDNNSAKKTTLCVKLTRFIQNSACTAHPWLSENLFELYKRLVSSYNRCRIHSPRHGFDTVLLLNGPVRRAFYLHGLTCSK